MDAIAAAAVFFTSLFLSRIGSATAVYDPSSPPPMPRPSSCVPALIMFSTCLSYVGLPPNDLDSNVTPFCCSAFSSVVSSGSGACLCYLLREPEMLGFPLNNTRLFSLPSDCSSINTTFAIRGSLETLCSEASAPLPPLRNPDGDSALPAAPELSPAGISSPHVSSPLGEAQSVEAVPNFAPDTDESDKVTDDNPDDSSAVQRKKTARRSQLLASSVNMLLTVIFCHL